MNLSNLRIKIFADGADLTGIRQLSKLPHIKGFTTNPTLMRKAGVDDYEVWAKRVLEAVPDRPVSFEVLSDDFDEMERQARKIASWGNNVYVKIPITNTKGDWTTNVIRHLVAEDVKVNITAVTTLEQFSATAFLLRPYTDSIISIFAGRVADTGCSPEGLMQDARGLLRPMGKPCIELLWASAREIYNIRQAEESGCHIITMPDKILSKLHLLGKDLDEFSLETVKQFYDDAVAAGYTL